MKSQQNFAAVALLWTQEILLIRASTMPKEHQQEWIRAAQTPICMLHYASHKAERVAKRISNARIERFVRNSQGRRLPA
jgi:hypothetical protein